MVVEDAVLAGVLAVVVWLDTAGEEYPLELWYSDSEQPASNMIVANGRASRIILRMK